MSEKCDNNCASCAKNCKSRKPSFAHTLGDTKINKIIGVISGKGGVGKSFITGTLASLFAKKGYKVGILDADITGSSIPRLFGINQKIEGDGKGMYPAISSNGIKIMSLNLLLDQEENPVLWRGPILSGAVLQFYSESYWGELDYLFVDMPPGTSDIALTVLQSIPLDGLVMVTTPSSLVSMIVSKAIIMAQKTGIKVLGLVNNMAYVICPDCGKKIILHHEDETLELLKKYNIDSYASLPLNPLYSLLFDEGRIEDFEGEELNDVIKTIENLKK